MTRGQDPTGPAMRVQAKRPNRPSSRASFTFSNAAAEGTFEPGTPEFLFWQCREAGLASLETWESFAGVFKRWQGNRKKLQLLQDEGVDVNAFYDRNSFAFFHRQIGDATFFSAPARTSSRTRSATACSTRSGRTCGTRRFSKRAPFTRRLATASPC